MKDIALCMIVKNEEVLLKPLLEYVSSYVDEIVIVDTGSTDKTVEVAAAYATQVCYYPFSNDFSAARNYGQILVRKPWVLTLDADEWPTQKLLNWIERFVPPDRVHGVSFQRENRIDGVLLSNKSAYEWHVRLYRREHPWIGAIHEHVWIPDPERQNVKAPATALLLHHKTSARQEQQNELYRLMAAGVHELVNIRN